MKIQKVASWFGPLIFIAIVSGCAQPAQSTPTFSLGTPTLPIIMMIPATPTQELSPTNTPKSTATPTAVPTLPIEDAREQLLGLLASNGGCQLPCLWGITPGKSSNLVARSILLPLRGIAETAYFDFTSSPVDDISPFYKENDLRLNTRVAYVYDNDGVVNYIIFRVLEEQVITDSNGNWISRKPIFGLPSFIERTEYYSLAHLLSEQGIPASVMIASSGLSINRDRSIRTRLAVFYPDQGIWAQYTTLVNEKEVRSSLISCPANAHIEMVLSPPGNPESFFSLLGKTDWGITKNSYKPLDEVTSMSIEEFYETFRNPTDKCIETPINIWPTPER